MGVARVNNEPPAAARTSGIACPYLMSYGIADSLSPLFSPGGEAKCVRGPSVQGVRHSARGGVLEQYIEHGEQAQRRNGGPIVCFDRQLGRVEDGRGCSGRLRRVGPVSRPRSSNRTCGFPASGSPTGFLPQAVAGGGPRCIRRRRSTPNWPNTTRSLNRRVPRDDTFLRLRKNPRTRSHTWLSTARYAISRAP